MEVWGGLECTINKVGDQYFDQLKYAGHYNRSEDLVAIADLGIKKIRYPILWEKYQPKKSSPINWTRIERKLNYLKGRDIQIIAGLVHHGSGPAYVNLLDDTFANGLALYAAEVATQFPWIEYYTPINEPLTTARFCGLYGFWSPHGRDDRSFLTILLNECKATVLAMRAVRKINPVAKFVFTEDLGYTHCTTHLQYQADFENQRKWLSLDILAGKVDSTHPLWNYLLDSGISEVDLNFFILHPCPPDIVGFNYYITSERFIDTDLPLYPGHFHGGNGKDCYADVEVVRTDKASLIGPYQLLKEAWEKYKLPLAITEAHLHCSREEQLRWFNFIYNEALRLENEKVDIRGVTAWALLGSYGWDMLLTSPNGVYEPGVFDIRSGKVRATAIAKMITHLTKGQNGISPVLCGGGWWERESRIIYGVIPEKVVSGHECPPLLILGKTGTLGQAFSRLCEKRGLLFEILNRKELDVLDIEKIEQVVRLKKPWAIVNTTGFVRVDDAESEKEACYSINAEACKNLALICEKYNIKLLTFSTDLVFDGESDEPYTEDDQVNPLNIYGKSKVVAEELVLNHNPNALIIRSSTFFGPWDKYNFLHSVSAHVNRGETFTAPGDILVSPTYLPDLVNVSLDLLIDDERGVWHLANKGEISPAQLAILVAKNNGADLSLVINQPAAKIGFKAVRPNYSVLRSKRGDLMPSLENALERYFLEVS